MLDVCTHSEFGVGFLIEVDSGENISCVLFYFKDAGTVWEVLQVHFVVHSTGCCALWGKKQKEISDPMLNFTHVTRYFV